MGLTVTFPHIRHILGFGHTHTPTRTPVLSPAHTQSFPKEPLAYLQVIFALFLFLASACEKKTKEHVPFVFLFLVYFLSYNNL